MGLKSYIGTELLLEGGNALKQTNGIKQKHVLPLLGELLPVLAKELQLHPNQLLPIGSAGRKSDPEALSGDIDIAIQTSDLDAVKAAIQRLGADGSYKAMPAINVYSFAAKHPDGLVQVDLMPVSNIRLAAWAFHSANSDLQAGLKGSHRNELLFALAKHTAMTYHGVGDVKDAERERYQLNLNYGLFKVKQTRMGKKGKPVKSYTTTNKELVTADPDEICKVLFGYAVPASQVLSFHAAFKAVIDGRFMFPKQLDAVLKETVEGLKRKELSIPPVLQQMTRAPLVS